MSLSEILVPNTYNLLANSFTSSSPIVDNTSFSAILSTGVTGAVAPYTVVFDSAKVANAAYSTSTGIYTVPVAGNYHFNVGVSVQITASSTPGQNGVTIQLRGGAAGATVLQTVNLNVNLIASAVYTGVIPLSYFGAFAKSDLVKVVISAINLQSGAALVVNAAGTWFQSN